MLKRTNRGWGCQHRCSWIDLPRWLDVQHYVANLTLLCRQCNLGGLKDFRCPIGCRERLTVAQSPKGQ